jgi:hypothetical protein
MQEDAVKYWHKGLICATLVSLGGCDTGREPNEQPAPTEQSSSTGVTELDATSLPGEVTRLVSDAVPGIQIQSAERKEREGRIYYDVEGTRPDGSEVELDVLNELGRYEIVEIQRDIPWTEAPEAARAAAAASAKPSFEPVRVIESRQTDGSVIYELFAEGAPQKPALEVRVRDGKAEVLQEEWPH